MDSERPVLASPGSSQASGEFYTCLDYRSYIKAVLSEQRRRCAPLPREVWEGDLWVLKKRRFFLPHDRKGRFGSLPSKIIHPSEEEKGEDKYIKTCTYR